MPEESNFHDLPLPDPNDPNGVPTPPDPMAGNRPAEGARQVSPGEVLTGGFQTSANAGDFLGLDMEVGEYDDPSPSLDLSTGPNVGAAAPTEGAPEAAFGAPAAVPQDETYDYEDVPIYEEEDAFPEEEEAFPEEFDDSELAPAGSGRGMGLYVLAAFALGLAGVVGVKYGPQLWQKYGPASQRVATGPGDPAGGSQTTATGGNDSPAGGPEAVANGTPATNTRPPRPVSTEPDPFAVTAGNDPWLTTEVSDTEPVAYDPDPLPAPEVTPFDFGAPGGGGDVERLPQGGVASVLSSGLDWASADQLDMIWRDSSIPMEAIDAPARILTPRVGNVRVHMNSGEVFEGRLYALGQGQAWIDTPPGRLGLDGSRVAKFERLPYEQVASGDPIAIATGERVRVKVPGGVLYGRVLSSLEQRVTLVTDDGGRVTLHEAQVEPLGPARAIVIER